MTVAYLTHAACRQHAPPPGHPECPARLAVIEEALVAGGLLDFLTPVEAPRCEAEALERVHQGDLLTRIREREPRDGFVAVDGDTFMNPGSVEAALRAAGAAVHATELVLTGVHERAFCAVRPPGHHASVEQAMGFCLFNNIAVATAHALASGRAERVAILDFDAHRGNGTEDIFAGRDEVLFLSLYQTELYPPPRGGPPADNVAEAPLPPGAGGDALREAVEGIWWPALARHRPDLLLVSAGFDGHLLDELSALRFTDADYRWVSEACVERAERHCGGRLVSLLEGGYHLPSLGRCVSDHVRALMGL